MNNRRKKIAEIYNQAKGSTVKNVFLDTKRNKTVLIDERTNNMWANEYFTDQKEARDFAKQNGLVIVEKKMGKGGSVETMTKINVKELGGYMPGVKFVYYDNKSDKFHFTDHEGDLMEIKNTTTLEQLNKYIKENNISLPKKMAKGGSIKDENTQMVLNDNNQITHHTKELPSAIKGKKVPAWVVAKVHDSATDLSDVTHYLDGEKKFEKGGKVSKEYMVFNYTDNIYASDETFTNLKRANKFIKEFRKRYEKQGYYRDNKMNKINPKDIDLLAIPSDFNPYKKMEKGGGVDGEFSAWKISKNGVEKLKTGTMAAVNRFLNKEKKLQNQGKVSIFDGKSGVVTFPSSVTEKEVIKYNNGLDTGSATSQEYAKGGMVVTKIADIPNFQKRLDEGKITYRGLGLGKLWDDFHKIAGEPGTRIKVDGKEYFITDKEFDTFSRDSSGKLRIRFAAPYKKSYESGGSIDTQHEEYLSTINEPNSYLSIWTLGVSEPDRTKIDSASITDKKFDHRELILKLHGGAVERIPLEKIDDFMNGEEVKVKDSKGEPYILTFEKLFEEGGKIKDSQYYVAIAESKDGYWTVVSKPTSKKGADDMIASGVTMEGEKGIVVTLEEALAHKKIVGAEYLKIDKTTKNNTMSKETQEKIEKLKKGINNSNVSDKHKEMMKKQLAELEKEVPAPAPAKKSAPKQAPVKAPAKVTVSNASEEDCAELIAKRKQAKKAAKKRAAGPQKTPATKNKEKIEKVENDLTKRIAPIHIKTENEAVNDEKANFTNDEKSYMFNPIINIACYIIHAFKSLFDSDKERWYSVEDFYVLMNKRPIEIADPSYLDIEKIRQIITNIKVGSILESKTVEGVSVYRIWSLGLQGSINS